MNSLPEVPVVLPVVHIKRSDPFHPLISNTMLSPTHANHEAMYKAAIVLNNTAVTLIERQQYQDAVDTFRRSISAIHTVMVEIRNPSRSEDIISSTYFNEITRHLHEASQRCAQSFIVHNDTDDTTTTPVVTATRTSIDNPSTGNVIVVKSSSQQSAISAIEAIDCASQGGAAHVYTCVMIEQVDQAESFVDTIDEVCNSIMYNFGVAHSILACQFDSTLQTEQILIEELQKRAFKLLRLIEPFFLAKIVCCPNQFHNRGVLLLCTLFVQAMSTVAHQLHYTTLWESYKDTLRAILVSIQAQETLIPTTNGHAAMA
jgi:hypothetical protein